MRYRLINGHALQADLQQLLGQPVVIATALLGQPVVIANDGNCFALW